MDASSLFLGFCGGLSVFFILFKIRHGSFQQQRILLLKSAEESFQQKQHLLESELLEKRQKSLSSLQQEDFLLQQRKRELLLLQQKIEKEREALKSEKTACSDKKKEADRLLNEVTVALEHVGSLTKDEAVRQLFHQVETEQKRKLEEARKGLEAEHQRLAHNILLSAMERKGQRLTKDHFLREMPLDPTSISRFIGKDGRNIQRLEELLGAVLTIEKGSNSIQIFSPDQKTLALAESLISALQATDKITPVTIQTAFDYVQKEFLHKQKKLAEAKIAELSLYLPHDDDLLLTIGSLAYRSTLGQNVLSHSVEVAQMMSIAAAELKLDPQKAALLGLLHDIGKGLTSEAGLTHAKAGAAFIKKFSIDQRIVEGVLSHHGEHPYTSLEARLLPICDRLSALCGCRRRDNFVQELLHSCEQQALSLPHVQSAWAHYAGDSLHLLVRTSNPSVTLPLLQQAIPLLSPKLPVHIVPLNDLD